MNADQLIAAHLERLTTDVAAWLELFAEDAVVEFPYAGSFGTPSRLEGLAAIRDYFTRGLADFEGLTLSNVRRLAGADPDAAAVEAHGSATIRSTGKRYEQDYVMFVRARGGRIVAYREYWNPLAVLDVFGQGGPSWARGSAEGARGAAGGAR